MKRYYELLNVKESTAGMDLRDATREALRTKYANKDKAVLKKICEAYAVLSDPEQKAIYDATSEEEYSVENNARVKAKINKLVESIDDQTWRMGISYGNTLKAYQIDAMKGLGIFLLCAVVAWVCFSMHFGYIIFIFPVAAVGGFFSGISNLMNYIQYKANQNNYRRNEMWRSIELTPQ